IGDRLCPIIILNRFIKSTEVRKRVTAAQVGAGDIVPLFVLSKNRFGFVEFGDRLVKSPKVRQRVSSADPTACDAYIGFEVVENRLRAVKLGDGFRETAEIGQRGAAVQVTRSDADQLLAGGPGVSGRAPNLPPL